VREANSRKKGRTTHRKPSPSTCAVSRGPERSTGFRRWVIAENRWIDGGMLLFEPFAFRFSERLVNEMTSNMIEQGCLVEIVGDNAKRD
jgi:hypothetical protein